MCTASVSALCHPMHRHTTTCMFCIIAISFHATLTNWMNLWSQLSDFSSQSILNCADWRILFFWNRRYNWNDRKSNKEEFKLKMKCYAVTEGMCGWCMYALVADVFCVYFICDSDTSCSIFCVLLIRTDSFRFESNDWSDERLWHRVYLFIRNSLMYFIVLFRCICVWQSYKRHFRIRFI